MDHAMEMEADLGRQAMEKLRGDLKEDLQRQFNAAGLLRDGGGGGEVRLECVL
jgi:hypothetical protein